MDMMGDHNPAIRYFVLQFTPYTMPRPELWGEDGAALCGGADIKVFGDAVYQEFMDPWQIFHFPSMAYRRRVTDYAY